ncbi:JAB domain-containing protein [Draconibacterium halophilum]|uniref:JAB domain-containing protein n=1 Tax=Draconibacterium halophilum TaxID=2706887 RepID=A0A6C0R9K3_9BACT|nr:JAB domain-containing protein [Draconibacterium halophilum]QIA07124.1 JAB domain-containing protein [Draconibacterium halophilum]
MTLFQQNIAEVTIKYSHKIKPSDQVRITGSKSVYDFVCPLWPDLEYRERFAVLLLSRSLKVLGLSWISTGGVSGTVVDAKLIFQVSLKSNASSIILLHNHPSGELRTSEADRRITRKIKDGAKLLDIDVLEHIILTSETYYSMADEGEL